VTTASDRDVAVIGAGVKAPGGPGLDALWQRLLTGKPAISRYRHPELPASVSLMTGEVDFDPGCYVTPAEARRLDRVHLLAIGAADDALRDCPARPGPARCAVVCGQSYPSAAFLDEKYAKIATHGFRGLSPLGIPMMMVNSVAAHLALRFGFQGPCLTVATACASGSDAIGQGTELLRRGAADLVLAGGVEGVLSLWSVLSFYRTGALSPNLDPDTASRPFDRDRDGFVLGEGAGFVVLQRLADARAQDRGILGLIRGYGATCDAHHIVAPREDGAVARASAELALADAGLSPADIGHLNAHGTATVLNDLAEARAMADLFGPSPPPVTAVKGVTGHLISAAGAVEAIVALRSLAEGVIPPTGGYHNPDPAVGLDVVHGVPRPTSARTAMSNSFGFGGHNAVLVLAAPEP
jgi:3-oxoacyl-[acyl-carrier-protein] synthase II